MALKSKSSLTRKSDFALKLEFRAHGKFDKQDSFFKLIDAFHTHILDMKP